MHEEVSLTPWMGTGYRHIPQDSPLGVLDLRMCGVRADGHWHYRGQRTLYLACDEGVAITEWARDFPDDPACPGPHVRSVFRLDIRLDAVVDLRTSEACAPFRLKGPLEALDAEKTRAIAHYFRSTRAQALLVPPAGTLDRPEKWNLVIFLEKFEHRHRFVTHHRHIGTFEYRRMD